MHSIGVLSTDNLLDTSDSHQARLRCEISLLKVGGGTMMQKQDRPIPIPVEDDILHTQESPFCDHPTCPCHEDSELLSDVALAIKQGLLTHDEATRFVMGSTV
jgi:hypothetical protein